MANFKDIVSGPVPTLVDFSAEWCGPCKMMAPILQQVKEIMGDKVKVVKIDVDQNRAIAEAYQVQGVPTLMVFKDGKLKWRESGVRQAQDLVRVIQQSAD